MKSFFLFLLFNSICYSQIINFPDINFKNMLLAANASGTSCCTIGNDINGSTPGVIDTNGNGEIEVSEAQTVAIMQFNVAGISDTTGIEYFTNLAWLNCSYSNLTSINVSTLTKLKRFQCRNNQITSLNLTNLTFLKELLISNNPITSLNLSNQPLFEFLVAENNQSSALDFSNNPALQRVYCGGNLLTSLDFSSNPAFLDLGCRNNPNLSSIKIRNGTTQLFGAGTYYNQCWTNVPNLNYICADSAEIPALQTFLSGCGVTQAITIDSACPLGVASFSKETFTIAPNPSNGVFEIIFNEQLPEVASYQVYDLLGKKIFENKIEIGINTSAINLENYPSGVYLLHIISGSSSVNKKLIKK